MTVQSMIEVFNPTGRVVTLEAGTAPRISELNGKVIGFMNNSKTNFDLYLERTEELLRQRFEFADILHAKKAGSGAGATSFPKAQIDEFVAKCDVVVNGIGE